MELPEGWEWVQLSNSKICEINPKKAEVSKLPHSTPVSFLPMSGVSEDGIIATAEEKTLGEEPA